MEKRGQFNFVWLFAIIAGGAILFLAVYGAMQAGDTKRFQTDTEVAKSIAIIMDPLQAGFAEGSIGRISFQQETRVNNICFDGAPLDTKDRTGQGFGKNDVSVATRSNVGAEWNSAGGATSVHNKYIFSDERNSGFDYYVFSKPFSFPYKVADLTFLTTANYCFLNAPEEVADEIVGLRVPNIEVEHPTGVPLGVGLSGSTSDGANCTIANAINVCFGGGGDCDVIVYGSCSDRCDSVYDEGTVSTKSGEMKYVGNLMYAAIFSEKDVYDCNVKRLLYRAGRIAEGFVGKANLMDARNCDSGMQPDLNVWSGLMMDATAGDLMTLRTMAEDIERKNDRELCGVW